MIGKLRAADEISPPQRDAIDPEPVRRNTNRLTFRGLSTDPGLAFIDGVPYGGTETPDVTDVARIEVLKGPKAVRAKAASSSPKPRKSRSR